MDIIFQSGDFYNQSDFLSSFVLPFLGILIPAIIAVVLFNKGIKRERELDEEKRIADLKQERLLEQERRQLDKLEKKDEYSHKLDGFGNHFTVLLDCCIETSRKQIVAYKTFCKEFTDDILGRHYPMQYPHEDMNRLLQMDTERILEFFESKGLEKKDFTNAIHQLDYLNVIFQEVPNDMYEGNGKDVLRFSNDVIKLRELILKTIVDHLGIAKQEGRMNELLNVFLNKLVVDYYDGYDGVPYVKWDYDKLITPLLEEFNKPEYLGNAFANELRQMAYNGANIVCTIRQTNENLCNDILKVSERIEEESMKVLTDIYEKLPK